MGRSVSNNAVLQSNLYKKPWDGLYTTRPVWGLFTMAAGSQSAWVYAYGEDNRLMSIGHDRLDSTQFSRTASNLTGSGTEQSTSGYYVAGSSATQVSSQSWSPQSGYFGINSNSQTALLNNAYAFQNGNIGYMYTANQCDTQAYAATQIMHDYTQQDYDIVGGHNTATGYIQSAQAETVWQDVDFSYTHGNITANGLLDTTNHINTRFIMSYNRRTNTMAFMFHCADSNSNTKRIHLFKMNSTFQPNRFTTGDSIRQALVDSKAAGGYTTALISLPSWHNNTSTAGRHGGKLVLCDDNTLWFVSEPPANGSSGAMYLYSIIKNGSGVYTATQVKSIANTTHYNLDAGTQYALHHQNSDDNKYIAIYTHYYYYLGGYNMFIVSTTTAAPNASSYYDYSWFQEANSNGGYTIAPSGRSEFVVAQSYPNYDGGTGPYLRFHDVNQRHSTNNTQLSRQFPQYIYPGYSTSTNYQGYFVFKYQPLSSSK